MRWLVDGARSGKSSGSDAHDRPREPTIASERRSAADGRASERRATSADASVMSAQSRTLRNSVISLLVFFALRRRAAAVRARPAHGARHIADADPAWLGGAVCLELLSCAGYAVLFGLVFGMLGRRLTSRLSLAELAVNSVVSVSGLAGIALGAWVLRSKGVSVDRIARRSVLIFVLTSAVNVGAVVADRRADVARPAARLAQRRCSRCCPPRLALATIAARSRSPRWARRAAARRAERGARRTVALKALADGVADALRLIREHDWRLLGAVAYWLFDTSRCTRAWRLRQRAVLLGRRDGLPGRHARQLDSHPRRAASRSKAASSGCCCCSACARPRTSSSPSSSTARSRCGSPP